jgi:hypothetical protein
MDDILYIVFLVAWVAFGFYKSSQKAKRKTVGIPAEPAAVPQSRGIGSMFEEILSSNKGVDDILGEFLGGKTTTNPEMAMDTVSYNAPVTESSEKRTFDKRYSKTPYTSKAFEEGQSATAGIVALNIDNQDDTSREFDFDLRRAVIYASIIDRPYK